jgi:hypothetical protein
MRIARGVGPWLWTAIAAALLGAWAVSAQNPGDPLEMGFRNPPASEVANLWVNRLIGDQQPNVAKTYTYTTQQFYRADSPLLPSGLLGPVQVVRIAKE